MKRYVVYLLALLSLTGAGCYQNGQYQQQVSFFEKKKACATYIDKIKKEIEETNSDARQLSIDLDARTYRYENLNRVCYVESIDSCVSVVETTYFYRKGAGTYATEVAYKNILTNDFIGISMSPAADGKVTNPESYALNYSNYIKQNEDLAQRYKCVE